MEKSSREKSTFSYEPVKSLEELDVLSTFSISSEYIENLKKKLRKPNSFQMMAKSENGNFAGYVSASDGLFPEHLFLEELFVNPVYRNQDIATGLVRKVIEAGKAMRRKGIMTETESENIPAQSLYEKLGFKKVDNPDWNGVTYKLDFDR